MDMVSRFLPDPLHASATIVSRVGLLEAHLRVEEAADVVRTAQLVDLPRTLHVGRSPHNIYMLIVSHVVQTVLPGNPHIRTTNQRLLAEYRGGLSHGQR